MLMLCHHVLSVMQGTSCDISHVPHPFEIMHWDRCQLSQCKYFTYKAASEVPEKWPIRSQCSSVSSASPDMVRGNNQPLLMQDPHSVNSAYRQPTFSIAELTFLQRQAKLPIDNTVGPKGLHRLALSYIKPCRGDCCAESVLQSIPDVC